MFRALLAYLQEVLHKQQLVFCVCVLSVRCYQDWSGTPTLVAANRLLKMSEQCSKNVEVLVQNKLNTKIALICFTILEF
jgi:hypothetical protein